MWDELEFLEEKLDIDFNLPKDGAMPENNEIRGSGPDGEVVTYIATPGRFKRRPGKMVRNRTWLEINGQKYRVSEVMRALTFPGD